jgi:hypothetical protein
MELPSDPNKLIYGIYNRYGEDVTAPKPVDEIKSYAQLVFQEPDDYQTPAYTL